MNAKRFGMIFGLLLGIGLFAAAFFATARPAAAQGGPPDMTKFGYPTVLGTANYTPGTAMTVTGGNQQVVLPADFISKTVKFELLGGDIATWANLLPEDDRGRQILAAFAFRVTDSNGALVGRFDKPVIWSVTDPAAKEGAEIYNTTAANPPVISDNPTPPTLQGTTLSHSFGGAGVGWLAVNPEGASAPVGMPTTGSAGSEMTGLLLAALAGLVLLFGGLAMRRFRFSR